MVEFCVRVPSPVPSGPVYISGDAEVLGQWRPNVFALERLGDDTFRGRVDLPYGLTTRYLVTRGSWRTCEGRGEGHEVEPRTLTVTGSLTVDILVARWGRFAVHYYPGFASEFVPHPRPITVWTPPGYGLDGNRRYPVFYMNDGQNLFDPDTAFGGVPWRADETAERLIRQNEIQPFIIVGVGNTPDRIREYGPRNRLLPGKEASLAKPYAKFLVDELRPFIDRTYRTIQEPRYTAIGGSSMGGLSALHVSRWYPGVFGLCAAMSPSLWWEKQAFLRSFRGKLRGLENVKIWLDMGGREGSSPQSREGNLNRARKLAETLRDLGRQDGRDFVYHEVQEGEHNEAAWGYRFDRVLKFFFGHG